MTPLEIKIHALVKEAVETEREACAEIVEDWLPTCAKEYFVITRAIRGRGKQDG